MKRRRPKPQEVWRPRRGLVVILFFAGIGLLVFLTSIFGEQGLLKVRQLEKEKRNLEVKIASLEGETADLRGRVQRLRSDPFAYEKLARERLGLVREGEVVYDFRPDPLAPTP